MKEILYLLIIFLMLYTLYTTRNSVNVLIVSVCVVCLLIYTLYFKSERIEHFSVQTYNHLFPKINFEEDFVRGQHQLKDNIVLYVSTFNKKYVDFSNNSLVNIIDNEIGAIAINDLNTYTNEYFNQRDGIKINKEILLESAGKIFHNFKGF